MDAASARSSVIPIGPIASFAVAMITLGVTTVVKYRNSEYWGTTLQPSATSQIEVPLDTPKPIAFFNVYDVNTTNPQHELPLTSTAKTNRTLWQLVNSSQLHAGLQRVEPGAWIPSHSHETEELIVIISGHAQVYDENGFSTHVSQGSLIHFTRGSLHAIHNTETDQPLLLMWSFPNRFGYNKFQFQDEY